MKRPAAFSANRERGECSISASVSGPCVSTAIRSRSTPFRDELASHSLQAVNADEIERFHAFAYRCAWAVIEGEEITGYVIT